MSVIILGAVFVLISATEPGRNFLRRLAGQVSESSPQRFASANGWIITDDRRKAAWAATQLDAAALRFQQHFRTRIPKGVVVESRYAALADQIPAGQRAWTLRWPTAQFRGGDRISAGHSGDHHLTPDSALRHELGHLFFINAIFPNRRRLQYGSDAPDWLDEAAAMLMETDTVRKARLDHFHEQVCNGRLVPLDRFLTREHPVFATPKVQGIIAKVRQKGPGQAATFTIPVTDLGLSKNAAADFYAQASALSQYLIRATGEQTILGKIATDIRTHGDPALWHRRESWRGAYISGPALNESFAEWAHTEACPQKEAQPPIRSH
jgi:hypothetical protein